MTKKMGWILFDFEHWHESYAHIHYSGSYTQVYTASIYLSIPGYVNEWNLTISTLCKIMLLTSCTTPSRRLTMHYLHIYHSHRWSIEPGHCLWICASVQGLVGTMMQRGFIQWSWKKRSNVFRILTISVLSSHEYITIYTVTPKQLRYFKVFLKSTSGCLMMFPPCPCNYPDCCWPKPLEGYECFRRWGCRDKAGSANSWLSSRPD